MVKHNNVVPNAHFHKYWQRYIKNWFDQPANKLRRRQKREEKAAKLAPRPVNLLRPAVHSQTIKYNRKVRFGRGFTLDELKAAGISKKEALGIGIAVDHRRKNRSEESLQRNVERLKLYKSKLVIFPRNPTSKRVKKGDTPAAERAAAQQVTTKNVLSLPTQTKRIAARPISGDEKSRSVRAILKKERNDKKYLGARIAKKKIDAEKKAQAAKKKSKR